MHISYSPEQEQLRTRAARLLRRADDPASCARRSIPSTGEYGDGTAYRDVVRRLGRDGWLTLSWPTEYGGGGGSMLDQLIFTDEAAVAGVPVPFLTINTVGPTIMRFGTAEQRAYYLPRIAAGEIHFSIGYSEPEAGTDLAALRTRAVRDGDGYLINGQKMWTSLIQHADYVWLACRTDPDAPRHKGLSILIVPTDAPGFSWTPVRTVAGPSTSATYYTDVRVPDSALIGEENEGWSLITNQLNHERVALTSAAPIRAALREVRDWARTTRLADGRRVIDQEWVQLASGPGARQGRVPEAVQLAHRRRGGALARPAPPPRPPRSSAPSSPSRPTGCSWRCSARTRTCGRAPAARSCAAGSSACTALR